MKQTYDATARRLFADSLLVVERAPLADRKEGRAAYFEAMNTPGLVAERIGWLLDGSYGYGAYIIAREVLRSRMSLHAWLSQTIATLEWGCTANDARKAWKQLDTHRQIRLGVEITKAIAAFEATLGEETTA